MSKEIPLFFKEVKFKPLVPGGPIPVDDKGRTDKEVPVGNQIIIDSVTGQYRYDRPLWTRDSILDDFSYKVREIRESGIRIPLDGRSVFLVRRETLLPDNEDERRKLVEKYGAGILGTLIGDNARIEDGRFISRIGFRDQEHVVLPSEVMRVIAHEHGHTIGEQLPTVWEEMKAYAFEGFFMSRYLGQVYKIDGSDAESMHEIARNRVSQLTQRGIDYLEILAHLAEYGFGDFGPRDYAKHVGKRGRLRGKLTRHRHN